MHKFEDSPCTIIVPAYPEALVIARSTSISAGLSFCRMMLHQTVSAKIFMHRLRIATTYRSIKATLFPTSLQSIRLRMLTMSRTRINDIKCRTVPFHRRLAIEAKDIDTRTLVGNKRACMRTTLGTLTDLRRHDSADSIDMAWWGEGTHW